MNNTDKFIAKLKENWDVYILFSGDFHTLYLAEYKINENISNTTCSVVFDENLLIRDILCNSDSMSEVIDETFPNVVLEAKISEVTEEVRKGIISLLP